MRWLLGNTSFIPMLRKLPNNADQSLIQTHWSEWSLLWAWECLYQQSWKLLIFLYLSLWCWHYDYYWIMLLILLEELWVWCRICNTGSRKNKVLYAGIIHLAVVTLCHGWIQVHICTHFWASRDRIGISCDCSYIPLNVWNVTWMFAGAPSLWD